MFLFHGFRLATENEQLQKKSGALKSRIKILENDSQKHKEQMKVLIGKTDGDDQLITLLKAEITRLKEQLKDVATQLKQAKQESDQFASTRNQVVRNSGKSGNMKQSGRLVGSQDTLEIELNRMKRLMEQQASQIDTQDNVIRQLRNDKNKINSSMDSSYY